MIMPVAVSSSHGVKEVFRTRCFVLKFGKALAAAPLLINSNPKAHNPADPTERGGPLNPAATMYSPFPAIIKLNGY